PAVARDVAVPGHVEVRVRAAEAVPFSDVRVLDRHAAIPRHVSALTGVADSVGRSAADAAAVLLPRVRAVGTVVGGIGHAVAVAVRLTSPAVIDRDTGAVRLALVAVRDAVAAAHGVPLGGACVGGRLAGALEVAAALARRELAELACAARSSRDAA